MELTSKLCTPLFFSFVNCHCLNSLRAEFLANLGNPNLWQMSQAGGQIRPAFLHHIPTYYSYFSPDTWNNLISVLLFVWGFFPQIFQGRNGKTSLKSWRSSPSQALFLISVMFRAQHGVVIPWSLAETGHCGLPC